MMLEEQITGCSNFNGGSGKASPTQDQKIRGNDQVKGVDAACTKCQRQKIVLWLQSEGRRQVRDHTAPGEGVSSLSQEQ